MNTNYKSIILAISLFLALSASILAAPGDLDLSFGKGGIVFTGSGNNPSLDIAQEMAIQPDGKIVVVGDGALSGNTSWDFAVARYNTDGSLDTSFGGTGIVITPVSNSNDSAYSVAIQADGKIIVIGNGGGNWTVVRYNPNGSLDTSFGGTGIVITVLSAFENYAYSVAVQLDGKIVVVGTSDNPGTYDFAVVRYNADGSLDASFGNGGIVFTQTGGSSAAYSVAIRADGKIVAAGNRISHWRDKF
jgi:uncharacterized delta-60 repeat protein